MQADVLLVTVTEVESRAVLSAFERVTGPAEAKRDGLTYWSLGKIRDADIYLVQSEMGAGGVSGALLTAQKAIDSLSPQAVIMLGIAFGVDESKQAIGDILVSKSLICYELQRVGQKDGKPHIIPRGARPDAAANLLNYFRTAGLKWAATVRFGSLLSGEKLVDNVDFRDQLRSLDSEAIGGEMEGAGIYAACQNAKTDWILVKAICDWADGNKSVDKDARQQTAAKNAADFVLHALQFVAFRGTLQSAPYSALPRQPFFFGRDQELKIIAEAISPDVRSWGVLIDGEGGIGKTALAVEAADRASGYVFPRKIFLSAKVRDLTPAGTVPLEDFQLPNFLSLVTELGRALGDSEIGKVSEKDRARTVAGMMIGKQVLLIIDNLEAFPEQERVRVYQFVSRLPGGCKAIVTSRRRSDIDARIIRLERLDEKDALDLIAELAKKNPLLAKATFDERRTLYLTTGGNPQLLRWTAGQIGRPGSNSRTIIEACEYLRNAPKDNDPLEYIFGDLLDTFSETQTRALAALTYFTQPAEVEWIATMTALGEREVQTALEDLENRALLVADAESNVFFLPPLAAKFLRDKRPQHVSETGGRLIDRAYALAVENGDRHYERYAVLAANWSLLSAAIPRLLQGDNQRLQTFCRVTYNFMRHAGYWDDALKLNQSAEQVGIAAADWMSAGADAYRQAIQLQLNGEGPDPIEVVVKRAEEHWRKAQAGPNELAMLAQIRGLLHREKKEFAAAIAQQEEALRLTRINGGGTLFEAMRLANIGHSRRFSGDYDGAERDYNSALKIAEEVRDPEQITRASGFLAELEIERENWSEAESRGRKYLKMARNLGGQHEIGHAANIIARALVQQNRREEAITFAREAVEIFTRVPAKSDLARAQRILQECERVADTP